MSISIAAIVASASRPRRRPYSSGTRARAAASSSAAPGGGPLPRLSHGETGAPRRGREPGPGAAGSARRLANPRHENGKTEDDASPEDPAPRSSDVGSPKVTRRVAAHERPKSRTAKAPSRNRRSITPRIVIAPSRKHTPTQEERRPPGIVGVDPERVRLLGVQRGDAHRRQQSDGHAQDKERAQAARPLRLQSLDVQPQAGRDGQPEDEGRQTTPWPRAITVSNSGAQDRLAEVDDREEDRAQRRQDKVSAPKRRPTAEPLAGSGTGALHQECDGRQDDASSHRAHRTSPASALPQWRC